MYRSLFAGPVLCCAALLCVGCGSDAPPAKPNAGSAKPVQKPHTEHEEHGDHKPGPHGGTIADWGGGKYHVEFTVDHGKKETVIYVLGSDEKSPTPIKAETVMVSITSPAMEIEAKAQPLDGEPEGTSSRFVGTHDNLGKVQEFAGTITGEIDGTPYSGEFKEEAHEDHK